MFGAAVMPTRAGARRGGRVRTHVWRGRRGAGARGGRRRRAGPAACGQCGRLGQRQLGASASRTARDGAPAPARRPQTIDALFDSTAPTPRRSARRRRRPGAFPPPAAPRAPGRAFCFPRSRAWSPRRRRGGGDGRFPGLAPGRTRTMSSRAASSRTGTTATTAAARHDDDLKGVGRDGLGEDE